MFFQNEMPGLDAAEQVLVETKVRRLRLQFSEPLPTIDPALCEVVYVRQENFLACVLRDGVQYAVGMTKVNPGYDEFDEGIGRKVALCRAVEAMCADRTKLLVDIFGEKVGA